MGNVLRVLGRDLKRLATTPAAWAVILFLVVLPSLYTWFNVAGFWNPYDNTGNLRVCVVNEDEGATIEGIGELDLGSQIVGQLQDNDQLGWVFVERGEAEEEVRSGTAYAAFVMPPDFSADVASILSGDFRQPQIEYYVNEKVGPVAPKITDTGASALDSTINEAFVSAVSEAVVRIAGEKADEIEQAGGEAKSEALAKVGTARAAIAETRSELAGFTGKAAGAQAEALGAKGQIADARKQLDGVSGTLELVSLLAGNASSSLVRFTTSASPTLDEATRQVSQVTSRTNASIAEDANAVLAAKGSVDAAIARGQGVAQEGDQIIAELKRMRDGIPSGVGTTEVDQTIAKAEAADASVKRNLAGLQRLADDTAATATGIREASGSVNDAAQRTVLSSDEFREALSDSIVPEIADALSSTAAAVSDLSGQAASQDAIIDEALLSLDELSSSLGTAADALAATDRKLDSLERELDALATDLDALGTAHAVTGLLDSGRIDPASIADFMMSPTKLETEELYPLNAYGSAMAPLFINLTLWIGVFMLMVIMRLEVDDEGIGNLTITQRFWARFFLLAPLVCIQAAICCTGCLAIGVQCANTAAFFATAIMASLSYLAIQYTLSTTLQHVGKAMCIILVFVQIPGASGIYPIEMTPDFFQTVYPLFPFTYGINAMRESISGFYDGQWLSCIGVLAAFMAAFLAIGTIARPYLTNLNRMFAREIGESDLIVGENVELPARRWRMSQVIRVLSDREEYRTALEQRRSLFMRMYPLVKAGSLVAGIAVPVLIAVVFALAGADKVVTLTSWLVWLIAIVTFLIVIEFIRDNLSHQLSLEAMDVDEMRTLIGTRNRLTRVKPLEQDAATEQDAPEGDAVGMAAVDGETAADQDAVGAGAPVGAAPPAPRPAAEGETPDGHDPACEDAAEPSDGHAGEGSR